ncbi:MAG: hypothetical protein IKR18_09870, partial [Bacteroidaceae bacterium]|nr:hypothetical protein [Bacteroidaceae bacterium]
MNIKSFFICRIMPLCMMAICVGKSYSQTLEALNRGFIGVKTGNGVFLSWRYLGTDDSKVSFDLYRDGQLLNKNGHLTSATNYTDAAGTQSSRYTLKTIDASGNTVASEELAGVWGAQGKRIALDVPADVTTNGHKAYYRPNDISVGDVDGDGEYELILKWDPTDSRDNSQAGYTSNVLIDCYKLDGTKLWRIDLGRNIRAGAHYTQHLVFDFDGDGKAEVACKTAPGSIDGSGQYVTEAATDVTIKSANNTAVYTNSKGYILEGPEYYTIFSGETGKAIHTIYYNPSRNIVSNWGDSYGNRCDRFLATVAYTPDENGNPKPTMINGRGYYTYAFVWALQFDGQKLTERWLYSSGNGTGTSTTSLYGQGAHSMTAADVDNDGFDEIIFGEAALDHNGRFLYSTGWGHGDALHVGDFIPDREGLEVFMPCEEKSHAGTSIIFGHNMHDARTGEIIYTGETSKDNGRGICADISSSNRGHEFWSGVSDGVINATTGKSISSSKPSQNFRIYWDGDLYDELLDGTSRNPQNENTKAYIQKWNESSKKCSTIATLNGFTCNTTKGTPCFSGDILGDWREEVILRDSLAPTDKGLIIYTTTIPSDYRITTLPHDRGYRIQMTSEQCAYNQPPHLSYWLAGIEEGYNAIIGTAEGSGTASQRVELGKPVSDIVFTWKNAQSLQVDNLPAGLTASLDQSANQLTISGTPTEEGTFTFTVSTVNPDNGYKNSTLKGTITVFKPEVVELIAYYPFDGDIENKVSGQTAATKDYLPSFISGQKGEAISFNAASQAQSDCIYEPHYTGMDIAANSFTLEFWYSSELGSLSTVDSYLLHKGSHAENTATGATGRWFGIEYKNGALYFAIDDNVTKTQVTLKNAASYFNGSWHHLVAVRDAMEKKLNLYIDGALVGSTADLTGNIAEVENMVIGNVNVNFNNAFTGAIDELKIYKGAMSATAIADSYATVIEHTPATTGTAADVFTASGIKVRSAKSTGEALKDLKPGFYIVGGK